MKKEHRTYSAIRNVAFSMLLTLACSLLFGVSNSAAMDEGGCLTCHRYPGLVRLDKTNGIKALHIDEAKYFSSPHGKLRCVECHVTVDKVPHTGETKVDCTSRCHRGDDQKKLPADVPLAGFHKKEQAFISDLPDGSSCRVCHPLYPHSNNNLVRGFLNLHAGFMYCEVCHIKRDKFEGLVYAWESAENATFVGTPFGTYYNPQTRQARKSEHFISRISAFTAAEGKMRSLINTRDTARAAAFAGDRDRLEPDRKDREMKMFHADIERKEISVACNECHSEDAILDFRKLGFDEKKTKDLIYLNIKGLVTKYKTFFFPHLFGP